MPRKIIRTCLLSGLLCVVAFAPGCGCNQTQERTLSQSPTSPGKTAGTTDRSVGQVEVLPNRGLSIVDAAFIRSPDEGFGKKKRTIGVGPQVGPKMRGDFDRKYTQGVELMETGSYGDAMKMFEEILTQFPETEEASVAEYCIAEIHFRNKSNQLALKAFQRIVEKYPNSPAAQNAKEGIEYLETFEENEKNYVSPEVEDRKRNGY